MTRRGDIHLVDLEPVRGAEADKLRPAVVVSNDGANATAQRLGRGVITVVPVTTNTQKVHPFQTLLSAEATGLAADSKAQAEQVRSISVERLSARIGRVDAVSLSALDEALRVHLAL